jgi:hypothetical protein
VLCWSRCEESEANLRMPDFGQIRQYIDDDWRRLGDAIFKYYFEVALETVPCAV